MIRRKSCKRESLGMNFVQILLRDSLDFCIRIFKPCKYFNISLQFFTYTIIGTISVTTDFVTFVFLYWLFKVPYVNIVSYFVGTLVSFLLNAVFNFQVYNKWHVRYAKLLLVAGFGSLWSSWVIAFLISIGVWALVAKVVVLPFVLIYQYALAKRFVYN